MKLIIAVLLAIVAFSQAANWAVLVAGSHHYYNYRHHADIAHAQRILTNNGIPLSNIITMMYDDVANDYQNPFPGELYNKPDGPELYKGMTIDYKGSEVTAANWMKILRGEAMTIGSRKTLGSTENDHVFIYFADHGATGLVAMPVGSYLYADELQQNLLKVKAKEVVMYTEACESGSMFQNFPTDKKIWASTAANGSESSWGFYCGSSAVVKGKNIGSCLGDLYSISWMEDSDNANMSAETIEQQWEKVKTRTSKSHVQKFGDQSMAGEVIGKYQSNQYSNFRGMDVRASSEEFGVSVDSRDNKLHFHYHQYLNSSSNSAFSELNAELKHREQTDRTFAAIKKNAIGNMDLPAAHVSDYECLRTAVDVTEKYCGKFSDYSLKHVSTLAHLCEYEPITEQHIVDAIMASC